MAKKDDSSLASELTSLRLYKRNQGRLTRQLTAIGLALVAFVGAYTLSQGPFAEFKSQLLSVGVPALLALVGAWLIFRVVNYPRFADFLISVEGEMDKVSWASRQELFRHTVVVVVTMVFLGCVLLVYDVFWQWLFNLVGVLQLSPTEAQGL